MAEDFNDLLDQTETRAQALTLEADKAIALLDSVDETLDNLSSTIEESANEAQASFDTLTEQLTTAEDTLQTQQETARESMNGLMQQVQEAGGKIQESLTNAFNKFGELQAKQQEFLGGVGEEISKIDNGLEEFANEYGQIQENISNALEVFAENEEQFDDALTFEMKSSSTQYKLLSEELQNFTNTGKSLSLSIDRETSEIINVISDSVFSLEQPLQKTIIKSVSLDFDKFYFTIKELDEFASVNLEKSTIELISLIDNSEKNLADKLNEKMDKTEEIYNNEQDIYIELKKIKDDLG